MVHLEAKIVPYHRPSEEANASHVIDMRRFWVPETSHDPEANQSVELFVPGKSVPLYRSAPYPGNACDQIQAAVRQFIVMGVYSDTLPVSTVDALSQCSKNQLPPRECAGKPAGPFERQAYLNSLFNIAQADEAYQITLRPPQ